MLVSISATALLFGVVVCLEIGRRMGTRRMARDAERGRAGLGAIEGAIFGLLGLLIAFTFSGAASRFDARRQLVVEEANAIGTAYLRLDLLREVERPALRAMMQRYLDARLEVYRKLPDVEAARAALADANNLQSQIWTQAVAACQATGDVPTKSLLLPALNQMFDLTTTRTTSSLIHAPTIIFVMLFALVLVASVLAGYGMAGAKERSWVHLLGFALIMAGTVYVILDLEFPRLGLIRVDAVDQVLIDLRESMTP